MLGRLLMTLLLPELLDKVPNFYVPGQFDAELDQYSPIADKASQLELEKKRKTSSPPPYVKCNPREVADKWLAQLDTAISKRDALTIVSSFAPDASIHATVRDGGGKMTTLNFDRDEFSLSTVVSMKNLKDYKQRRISTKVETDDPASNSCHLISIKSVVIEQGIQSGKQFRFESLEEYVLELRDDKWVSINAATTQR